MTSVTTQLPLRVIPDAFMAYIKVPQAQLRAVEALLKEHGFKCWADGDVYSYNGGPAMGRIHLGRAGDPVKAQAVLDSVP